MKPQKFSIAAVVLALGCGDVASEVSAGAPDNDKSAPSYLGSEVITDDGSRFVGHDVMIRVIKADVPAELQVLAFAESQTWMALIGLSPEQLSSGKFEATILQDQMVPGRAWVERQQGGVAVHQAASGHITGTITGKRITLDVTADADLVSGSVSASYKVECFVPPGDLGLSSGGVQLVQDKDFESPFCQPFQ